MDINNIANEKPLSLNQYLLNRQKRKDEGKFVFNSIEYIYGIGTEKSGSSEIVDFDKEYKSIIDKTTDENATTNKP